MTYMHIVFFCRYTNHARTDCRNECVCHRLFVCLIMGKFSFGKERIGLTYGMVLHMHVHE
jgi:hypothetical protein